ncbi:ubiquitin carboxyl-terminal hydrolase 22 [Anaeramoeba ignava]|uniref:Ubiquitin carboxyl-terminal hydrolase 22 n=1 Tax=Anaeramoeba ignava TaxID=1746090 RepID=A0A9Q0LAW2_ANAIG|nr:ubiquitin carboxyl-terminal hydrolase 22 [Anaeramoeba ignava]
MSLFVTFSNKFALFQVEKIINFKNFRKEISFIFSLRNEIKSFYYFFLQKKIEIKNNSSLEIFVGLVKKKHEDLEVYGNIGVLHINYESKIKKNLKKEVNGTVKQFIHKNSFLTLNETNFSVYCSICDKELQGISKWKIQRHCRSQHHRLLIPLNLQQQKNEGRCNFDSKESALLRILEHLQTFSNTDFYSRKEIPTYRTGLSKKRIFKQISDSLPNVDYRKFCFYSSHYFCLKHNTPIFFQCEKCANPNPQKVANHRNKVQMMRNFFKDEVQDPTKLVIILDFGENIQEYRDGTEFEYYDYISEEKSKDSVFVMESLGKFSQILDQKQRKKKLSSYESISIFSDGGSSLKNNLVIPTIIQLFSSNFKKITIGYFLTNHGKNYSDAHFGNISRNRSSFGNIRTIEELDNYLKTLKNTFSTIMSVILKPGLIPKRRGRKRRIPIIKKIQIYDKDLANHNFQIQDVNEKNHSKLIQPISQNLPISRKENEKEVDNQQKEENQKRPFLSQKITKSKKRKNQMIEIDNENQQIEKKNKSNKIPELEIQNLLPLNQNLNRENQVIQTIPNSGNSCYIASIQRYIEVQDLRKEVGKHFVNFDNLNQQDLHEFFINLFELLDKETILDIPDKDDLLYHAFDLWNKTILNDFCIRLIQKVKCLECKHFSFSFPQETGILLSLESEKDCNLIELLNSFFSKNYFDENNLLFCEHCQKKVQSSFQFFLIHIPKFFMIFIKRSFYDPILKEERKNMARIQVPRKIQLNNFLFSPSSSMSNSLSFWGSIHHQGEEQEAKGGHFWTEVKDERNAGDFQVFDDSTTLTIPNPCRKSNSYVLMTYQRDDK